MIDIQQGPIQLWGRCTNPPRPLTVRLRRCSMASCMQPGGRLDHNPPGAREKGIAFSRSGLGVDLAKWTVRSV
jgi:hypothetical protein